MIPRIRVLVVEDSITVRKHIVEVLRSAPDLEVVGEAEDGSRAIDLCRELRPDVITLDMMLPVMSGLAATEFIMAHFPTPILIVSASTNRGELFKTYEALAAGAVDVLDKPAAHETSDEWARRLISTVRLVSRIRVITHPRAKLATTPPRVSAPTSETGRGIEIVAIGASTGGPAAIVNVLRALPRDFPLPILFVLHLGAPFALSFADWLDGQTGIRVAYAQGGERLSEICGRVTMAPPERHLIVQGDALRLTEGAERNFSRPSVDVLFESIARECGGRSAACLLTGMGRDGAEGLLRVRQAGGFTVAQDERSSVVFGMPGEAVRLAAAMRVVPIDAIGPLLVELAEGRS